MGYKKFLVVISIVAVCLFGATQKLYAGSPDIPYLTKIMTKQGFNPEGPKWVQNNDLASGITFIRSGDGIFERVIIKVIYNEKKHIGPLYHVIYMMGKNIEITREDGSVYRDEICRASPYEVTWKKLRQFNRDLKGFLETNRKIMTIEPSPQLESRRALV